MRNHPFYMKKLILLTALVFGTSYFLFAQTKGTIKVYAFKQSILTGRAPGGIISEDGNTVETKKKVSENYRIYTSSPLRIYPTEVWIKGTQYRVSSQMVSTPVVINPKRILVPQTKNKVLLLTPKEGTPEKEFKKGKVLAKENEVVIIYSLKEKFYYVTVKQFTALPAEAFQ